MPQMLSIELNLLKIQISSHLDYFFFFLFLLKRNLILRLFFFRHLNTKRRSLWSTPKASVIRWKHTSKMESKQADSDGCFFKVQCSCFKQTSVLQIFYESAFLNENDGSFDVPSTDFSLSRPQGNKRLYQCQQAYPPN